MFGEFACHVCSKILGIGSAEQSWGDVKHLKSNKRSYLSGDRVKKQSTIVGASCMNLSEMRRMYEDDTKGPFKFWTEEDFDIEFDMFQDKERDDKQPPCPVCIFKVWKEDWEEEAIFKKDPVNEARLLEKYGGLQWYDLDKEEMCTTSKSKML